MINNNDINIKYIHISIPILINKYQYNILNNN